MLKTLTLMPIAALLFASWAVYLGGLASLQSDCDSNGLITHGLFDDFLPCSKAYRLFWFYMAWEIVVITLLLMAVVTGQVHHMRAALVGLFAVSTVLFINVSNTMLDGQSDPYYTSGQPLHRIRATTAGAIMTALMNAIAMIVVGTRHVDDRHTTDKTATPPV